MTDPPECPVCGLIEATHAPCRALKRTEKKLKTANDLLRESMNGLKAEYRDLALEIRAHLTKGTEQ